MNDMLRSDDACLPTGLPATHAPGQILWRSEKTQSPETIDADRRCPPSFPPFFPVLSTKGTCGGRRPNEYVAGTMLKNELLLAEAKRHWARRTGQ